MATSLQPLLPSFQLLPPPALLSSSNKDLVMTLTLLPPHTQITLHNPLTSKSKFNHSAKPLLPWTGMATDVGHGPLWGLLSAHLREKPLSATAIVKATHLLLLQTSLPAKVNWCGLSPRQGDSISHRPEIHPPLSQQCLLWEIMMQTYPRQQQGGWARIVSAALLERLKDRMQPKHRSIE